MVSILLQNLLITRQVHIKTLTQGGTYLAKSTDAKLEIQLSSDADKMWVEEYPLTCMLYLRRAGARQAGRGGRRRKRTLNKGKVGPGVE